MMRRSSSNTRRPNISNVTFVTRSCTLGQVHKETIDAVPNAIPGRTDIELEIYGMEGIPEKDMEERRRMLEQKTQGVSWQCTDCELVPYCYHNPVLRPECNDLMNVYPFIVDGQKKRMDDSDYDDDDEGPSSSFPPQMQPQQGYMPAMAQPGLHGLAGAPGMPPGNLHLGIPPVMPGMHHGMLPMSSMMHHAQAIPPMMAGLHPGVPPPVGHRPGMPTITPNQPISAPGIGRLPTPSTSAPAVQSVPKPLFPSAGQAPSAVSGPVGTDFKPLNSAPITTSEPPKPTFPAYTQSTMSTTNTTNSTAAKPSPSIPSKPAILNTTSATSKLIHPDEDISLEEKRAQHLKYQRNLPRSGQAPISSMRNSAVGPLGALMAPQPGIPPQQPNLRHPLPPHGQFGGPHQNMPGFHPAAMPPFGQVPPMVPPFQGGAPRPLMGMRPPVMSQGGRY